MTEGLDADEASWSIVASVTHLAIKDSISGWARRNIRTFNPVFNKYDSPVPRTVCNNIIAQPYGEKNIRCLHICFNYIL